MDALTLGLIIGFFASLIAGALVILFFAWVQQPDLALVDDPYRHDLTYRVVKTPAGSEVRIRDDIPLPQGSYTRDLSYYSVSIANRVHTRWPFTMFPRNMAWATAARVSYRPFQPGHTDGAGSAKPFGYFGRWGAAPEPTAPHATEVGRYIEIPPRRKMGLNLAHKYDGDESAWGFSNESYLYATDRPGLWRHPDFEMPLHSHWRISVELETTRRFKPEYLHAQIRDATRHGLELHRWGGCSDCRLRDAGSI